MAETRVSQVATEALVQPDSFVRTSQVTAEALVQPDSFVRASQVVVEVLVENVTAAAARPQSQVVWLI